jgi:hypothetical protein
VFLIRLKKALNLTIKHNSMQSRYVCVGGASKRYVGIRRQSSAF